MDFRWSVPDCERAINDYYRNINRYTQEIADCNKKIDDLPKRINKMLAVGKQRRIESKEIEQEAERLRSKADSFCLRGMLGREVNGMKSQKHNDLLKMAEESARKKMKRENDAKDYLKSAIGYETDAKEVENHLNEFRRKKVNYRVRKRDWKEACQNWKRRWRKRKKI